MKQRPNQTGQHQQLSGVFAPSGNTRSGGQGKLREEQVSWAVQKLTFGEPQSSDDPNSQSHGGRQTGAASRRRWSTWPRVQAANDTRMRWQMETAYKTAKSDGTLNG